MDRDLVPITYQLLRIDIPADLEIEAIAAGDLPGNWRLDTLASREIGDRWLDQSRSAPLQVPSAISEQGQNFLLNPAHPDAGKVIVAEILHPPFDARLLG